MPELGSLASHFLETGRAFARLIRGAGRRALSLFFGAARWSKPRKGQRDFGELGRSQQCQGRAEGFQRVVRIPAGQVKRRDFRELGRSQQCRGRVEGF